MQLEARHSGYRRVIRDIINPESIRVGNSPVGPAFRIVFNPNLLLRLHYSSRPEIGTS
jgi:hypothetical protein